MYHIFFISPSVDGHLGCLSLVAVVLVPKVFFPGSFHRQRNLPDPGIETASPAAPALQADSLLLSHHGNPTMEC